MATARKVPDVLATVRMPTDDDNVQKPDTTQEVTSDAPTDQPIEKASDVVVPASPKDAPKERVWTVEKEHIVSVQGNMVTLRPGVRIADSLHGPGVYDRFTSSGAKLVLIEGD